MSNYILDKQLQNGQLEENSEEEDGMDIEENAEEETLIHMLNDDCLAEIFRYLPILQRWSMAIVCKKWWKASQLPWDDIKKFNSNRFLIDNNLYDYSRRTNLSTFLEAFLLRCGGYLTELSIERGVCDSQILVIVDSACNNLINLSMDLRSYNDEDLEKGFSGLKKLRTIGIRTQESISPNFLRAIQTLPEKLEIFWLMASDLAYISRDSSQYNFSFPDDPSIPTFQRFNLLHTLGIGDYVITRNVMEAISQLASLVKLDISDCRIEFDSFESFSRLKKIEILNLNESDIEYDVDELLAAIAENRDTLRHLEIIDSYPTDAGVCALAQLKKLEVLDLHMSDKTGSISESSISQLRNLKELNCSGCEGVTNNGLIELLKNSPDLEELDISFTSVTPSGVRKVAEMIRCRTNKVVLRITVNFEELSEYFFDTPEYSSPFLVINHEA